MEEPSVKVLQLILSPHGEAVIELLQSCVTKSGLVGNTEWETIVNAVRLDSQSDMIKAVITKIQDVRIEKGYGQISQGTQEGGV